MYVLSTSACTNVDVLNKLKTNLILSNTQQNQNVNEFLTWYCDIVNVDLIVVWPLSDNNNLSEKNDLVFEYEIY